MPIYARSPNPQFVPAPADDIKIRFLKHFVGTGMGQVLESVPIDQRYRVVKQWLKSCGNGITWTHIKKWTPFWVAGVGDIWVSDQNQPFARLQGKIESIQLYEATLKRTFYMSNVWRYPIDVLVHLCDQIDQPDRFAELPLTVAVYCDPKSDWNGAFENSHFLNQFTSAGRLLLYEASTEDEVIDRVVTAAGEGRVKQLILAAHGSSDSMDFGGIGGDQSEIDLTDSDFGERIRAEAKTSGVTEVFDDQTVLLLDSCSTNKAPKPDENFAVQTGIRLGMDVVWAAVRMASEPTVDVSRTSGLIRNVQDYKFSYRKITFTR